MFSFATGSRPRSVSSSTMSIATDDDDLLYVEPDDLLPPIDLKVNATTFRDDAQVKPLLLDTLTDSPTPIKQDSDTEESLLFSYVLPKIKIIDFDSINA